MTPVPISGRLALGYSAWLQFPTYPYLRLPFTVLLFWNFRSYRTPTTPRFERFHVLPLDVTRQREGTRSGTGYYRVPCGDEFAVASIGARYCGLDRPCKDSGYDGQCPRHANPTVVAQSQLNGINNTAGTSNTPCSLTTSKICFRSAYQFTNWTDFLPRSQTRSPGNPWSAKRDIMAMPFLGAAAPRVLFFGQFRLAGPMSQTITLRCAFPIVA